MDPIVQGQLLSRLKTVEGHVRGLQRMVEEEQYCVDILRQSVAVQRALDKVNGLLLEHHLDNCVTTAIRGEEPAERERVIRELVRLFTDAGTRLQGISAEPAGDGSGGCHSGAVGGGGGVLSSNPTANGWITVLPGGS